MRFLIFTFINLASFAYSNLNAGKLENALLTKWFFAMVIFIKFVFRTAYQKS